MKKALIFIFLFFTQVAALVAFEGGGLFSSGLNFDITTPKKAKSSSYLNNSNQLSLWLTQNMDKEGYYNFYVQGSAYLKIKKLIGSKGKSSTAIKTPLDIDMLRFSFFIPLNKRGNLDIDIGRKGLFDATAMVLNQPLDGFFLQYKVPQISLTTSIAFTGLLNANTVAQYGETHKVKNHIYSLQKSYVGFIAMLRIPIPKTSYSIDVDSLNFVETKAHGKNKLYLTIGARGPIIRRLFFSTYLSGSFVHENKSNNYGVLASGAVAYYFRKYNAKLGAGMQYVTGGKRSFQPFTLSHVSSQVFSPYSNIWNTGIKASIKPLKELYLQALCNVICKAQKEGGSLYSGFEWMARASYTIKKDISIETSLGQFIKKKGDIETFIGLKGVISF